MVGGEDRSIKAVNGHVEYLGTKRCRECNLRKISGSSFAVNSARRLSPPSVTLGGAGLRTFVNLELRIVDGRGAFRRLGREEESGCKSGNGNS